MRITQSMMARQYTKRVTGALGDLNYVNKQVGTGRKFFKGSENPAGAAKAYQLRRQYSQVADYESNLTEAQHTLQTKESAMDQVHNSLEDAYESIFTIMNGTKNTTENKQIVAKQLRAIQETIVADMNVKYGDKYLFGGGSVSEAPFTLQSGKLYYRGVDVSGEESFTWPEGTPLAGTVVKGTKDGSNDVLNLLETMSKEVINTDLGFGVEVVDGKIVQDTVYNTATPGLNVLGFGGGEPSKNVVLLLGQIASQLEADNDTQALGEYLEPFKACKQNVLNSITETGADYMFLEYTQSRLEDQEDNLATKISDTEHIDAEEAIMNLSTIDYMYQALLKTSNNILSMSFIDFMQ